MAAISASSSIAEVVLVAVVAAFASGLVLLAILGRYREAAWLADWEEMLSPEGRQHYEELRERFAREFAASHFTYRRARAAFDRGDLDSAAQLLEAGQEFVAALAPDRDHLLRTLGRYTRMLGAVAPLPPLRPAQFQLRELSTLAGFGWLAHQFLATVPERLTLRLGILRRGQATVLRVLNGAGRSRPGTNLSIADWHRIDAARADWSTLDHESLASFGSLVTALTPAERT